MKPRKMHTNIVEYWHEAEQTTIGIYCVTCTIGEKKNQPTIGTKSSQIQNGTLAYNLGYIAHSSEGKGSSIPAVS